MRLLPIVRIINDRVFTTAAAERQRSWKEVFLQVCNWNTFLAVLFDY
jgi:hypothetical protein